MKQKTFKLDPAVVEEFERFCRRLKLIEKRVASVALWYFMRLDAVAREQAMLGYDDWVQAPTPHPFDRPT